MSKEVVVAFTLEELRGLALEFYPEYEGLAVHIKIELEPAMLIDLEWGDSITFKAKANED